MPYRLVLSRPGPAKGEIGQKQTWLEQNLGVEGTPVHAGDLEVLQPLVRAGDIVVEDAVDGVKRKRVRQALDTFEGKGVQILSTAQVLSRLGTPLDGLGAGESRLLFGLLDDAHWEEDLAELDAEIDWQTMYHRGGRVPRDKGVPQGVSPRGSPRGSGR